MLTPKRWVETTNAIGIATKAGRYAATYAHKDIAFEFASWISPEFKLYIIEDYQRLKEGENAKLSLGWNLNRELSKLNYRIHTDAIKENLIPPMLTPQQISYTYASEADLLNAVLFGKTAKQWRDDNPDEKGNIRDQATIYQLLVLANMESYNAILIKQGKTQAERMQLLHELAVQQMTTLIRKYKEDAVNKADIETILKAGILAPSAKNRQPWKYYVYVVTYSGCL